MSIVWTLFLCISQNLPSCLPRWICTALRTKPLARAVAADGRVASNCTVGRISAQGVHARHMNLGVYLIRGLKLRNRETNDGRQTQFQTLGVVFYNCTS